MIVASPSAPGRERTFRDPAGWVELHDDAVYRFLHPAFQAELLEFLASPLAASLVAGGRLIPTEVLPVRGGAEVLSNRAEDEPLPTLRHPLVRFISYPWEWCPAQWLAAAELTLDLCRDLLAEGWILKDATPLNVLFRGAEPVFVDVASVARVDPTRPIWYAYSQFVRTFLLPMLAHTSLGWPLRAAMLRRDGYEPEEIFAALSLQQRLRQPALSAVTLPSMLGKTKTKASASDAAASEARLTSDPEVVQHILQQTVAKLGRQMRRAMPAPRSSTWTAYSSTAAHYSDADHAAKRSFVDRALQEAAPTHVLDVGANAGVYSELAAGAGASVVAIDTDLHTLDRLQCRLHSTGKAITPLVIDLANPTPGVGWRNTESASFLSRAQGHFDGVIMLAVIHHLLLHDHIPLHEVARLASTLTTRTLIIEWVPPTDVMFRELVRGRDAIFAPLTESAFRAAFAKYFAIRQEHTLANGRILFHMDKLKP